MLEHRPSLQAPIDMFIAFCGIDGSGKSTQLSLTENWLRQHNLDVRVFNSVSEDRDFFESYLNLRSRMKQDGTIDFSECGKILLAFELFKKSRAAAQALDSGCAVLTHRWTYSQRAFARHDSPTARYILDCCLTPDITFYFDVDAAVAVDRIRARGSPTAFEDYETLARARDNFLRLCSEEAHMMCLDGGKSIDGVFATLTQHLTDMVCRGTPPFHTRACQQLRTSLASES